MREITIVGLGGIGSHLSSLISRYENHQQNNIINLIDGDKYEYKNYERQDFIETNKNKATSKKEELSEKFRNLTFNDFPIFIDSENVSTYIRENSIIFVCVDNHKTRKIINTQSDKLQNIIIISGGNELIDGNVQIYIRINGEKITASLIDYHPEINYPEDKHPNELSCLELENSQPQLLFTNVMVSILMACAYRNILLEKYNVSEVYFDIDKLKVHPKERKPKN